MKAPSFIAEVDQFIALKAIEVNLSASMHGLKLTWRKENTRMFFGEGTIIMLLY